MPNEGKENIISVQDPDNDLGLRTPLNQMKRTDSLVRGNRRPLASKDNNRTQSILGVKNNAALGKSGHPLKRPASSFMKNMPENKLKKYGSVLGMNTFMPRTKSLVLKDTELNEKNDDEDEEDEEEDDLPILSSGKSLNLGFGNGLKALIREKEDELNIEYAPKREKELPYIPNGYDPFDKESIEKLQHHRSPFQVESITFDTEERDPELISLAATDEDLVSPTKYNNHNHNLELDSDNESITIELSEEYNGKGLDTLELNSLLD